MILDRLSERKARRARIARGMARLNRNWRATKAANEERRMEIEKAELGKETWDDLRGRLEESKRTSQEAAARLERLYPNLQPYKPSA